MLKQEDMPDRRKKNKHGGNYFINMYFSIIKILLEV